MNARLRGERGVTRGVSGSRGGVLRLARDLPSRSSSSASISASLIAATASVPNTSGVASAAATGVGAAPRLRRHHSFEQVRGERFNRRVIEQHRRPKRPLQGEPAGELVAKLYGHQRIESKIHQPIVARRRLARIELQHLTTRSRTKSRSSSSRSAGSVTEHLLAQRASRIDRLSGRRRALRGLKADSAPSRDAATPPSSEPGTRAAITCCPSSEAIDCPSGSAIESAKPASFSARNHVAGGNGGWSTRRSSLKCASLRSLYFRAQKSPLRRT